MKEIKLTRGKVALVDDEDYGFLMRWKWFAVSEHSTYYAHRMRYLGYYAQKEVSMHRIIMDTPEGWQVDHKDGDGLNNQKSNLRNCSPNQNRKNRRKNSNNTSGYKGVYFIKVKRKCKKGDREHIYILARITVDNKRIYLGSFKTTEEAACAYREAAIKYFGEFAREES